MYTYGISYVRIKILKIRKILCMKELFKSAIKPSDKS